MTDFISAIEKSQKVPDLSDHAGTALPDFLSGGNQNNLVTKVLDAKDGKIPGVAEVDLVFCSARLVVGKEMAGIENGNPVFEDVDDSNRLKEIMDMILSGEAILNKKLESFLKDGTMVIWIEWLEPKKAKASVSGSTTLSYTELMSPEMPDIDSDTPEDDSSDY